MAQYRSSSRVPWLLLLFVLAFLVYQLRDTKLRIETPPDPQVQLSQTSQDPCKDLRASESAYRKKMIEMRIKQELLLADLAIEVELFALRGKGTIPAYQVIEIVKKHDLTESKTLTGIYKEKIDARATILP
jgi:hypothetical protein